MARIDHAVTSGTFSLDGERFDVDNNVWAVGDDDECIVIDAPHDADAILQLVAGRHLVAIVCTHAHDDHVRVAPAVAAATGAPILLHPADAPLWALTHPRTRPDADLSDGQVIEVGGVDVHVIHTPGHAPGACCLYVPALGVVFSGDTLFAGGPGATGRSFSDFPTITRSIRDGLLTLPPETIVHTGHGDSTTIGDAAAHIDEWEARGA
jgi:glyoxylase-like metal-dependent hydrolase (beta-lactamase superfamily II)